MENKQLILDSLCSALQLTRDQADLEALEYKAYLLVAYVRQLLVLRGAYIYII